MIVSKFLSIIIRGTGLYPKTDLKDFYDFEILFWSSSSFNKVKLQSISGASIINGYKIKGF